LNNLFRQLALHLLALPRIVKRAVALLIDAGLCVFTVWLAFYLRLGEFLPLSGTPLWTPSLTIAASLAFAIPIFIVSGLYRAIFRYNGLPALMAIFKAMLIYSLIYSVIFTFIGVQGVPRTIGLIQPVLLLFFVGLSRMVARFWLGGLYLDLVRKTKLPQVLIYGAGSAGRQLALAMASSSDMKVIGFLDDDARLHGSLLNELPIYNPIELADLISSISITDVLLALPTATRERRNLILNTLAEYKLAVRNLPDLGDIASGRITVNDLRELDIDDLLGREPVKPNQLLLNLNTRGKTVLVTGAGGSIGSELCRQILSTLPKKLLLVEMSEFALYQIHQELQTQLEAQSFEGEACELIPLLASVCDAVRMQDIMATWKPQTVYHAAAYKHVPLVEHNPAEGVRNNVLGTRVCAEAAAANGIDNFVLISTDKAVRPTNVMGASKRLSEMVLQALAHHSTHATTIFSMVRFGNVLGSSGSVVPLFRDQIKSGGPITLTHADITRYFMTIPEAAQLVIQAGAMGTGGDVFVLDMGQPVRIVDLAKRMVELSGLVLKDELHPDGDIDIAITGLRPGEKLFEELLIGDNPQPTQHPRIMKANEDFMPWHTLQLQLDEINTAVQTNDVPKIRGLLQSLVPGYQPSDEVVDWVHMAEKLKAT
jgi:FlaA1/EpsC-like NDP-sugar epimerase